MSEIPKLMDELNRLCDSSENKRRMDLWKNGLQNIRGEAQWHGIPRADEPEGSSMPVTAECLEKIWENTLGLRLNKYYTDPDYFLEYYLKIRLAKFKEFPDDTPLTRDIPVSFGVLTVDSIEQAIERSGTKAGNKGGEAAVSAIEMVNLLRNFD